MRIAATMLVLVAACARERDGGDTAVSPTWREDVAPVVAERCGECHGGDAPAGGYDLTTYLGALGGGSDRMPNAIAGDESSAILTTDHVDADVLPLLRAWVIGGVGYFDSPIHPPDILDRTQGGFHGHELASRDWDFALCQSCHGEDYGGGASGAACTTCHEDGPTACDTCHEAQPSNGPHPTHRLAGVPCSECHDVPARWDAPGHLDAPPADVHLGALAARDLDPPRREGPPVYEAGTCRNVYCHGGVFADTAALASEPMWTTAGDQTACGGCHGTPPSDHGAGSACTTCHRAEAPHLDGAVDLGDGSGTCSACHGDAASAAPFQGAHRSHALAPSGLRGPVACGECHVMPTTITSPGHVDTPFPAEVVLSTGAWNEASCAGTYCHGAATPVWNDTQGGQAACGTCHGIPPASAPHDASMTVWDCETCHPAMSAGMHMDGDVDNL